MDRVKLQKCYGRLKGLRDIVSTDDYIVIDLINDYNTTVCEAQKILNEDLESFIVKKYRIHNANPKTTKECGVRSCNITNG